MARMCVHLDGLPLALELAASYVKIFPLAALAERLDGRLSLLTGGPCDLTGPPAHAPQYHRLELQSA